MNTVQVRVPATTANLGPGFDAMGIALSLYNITTVHRRRGPDPGDMATAAGKIFFEHADIKPFDFSWSVEGDVPRSRGLGSSVTVRLGILHGLNALAGKPIARRDLFELCTRLEGHPDNAAPAAFGGFCISPRDGTTQRFPVSKDLAFVLLVPSMELETSKARGVLPAKIPLADAALSAGNAAAIAGAFASGQYRNLTGCFTDRLHQPYRAKLMPYLDTVIQAGTQAGALGGWLSGAGSTVACITLKNPVRVANAMAAACGIDAWALVIRADNAGVRELPSR